MGVWWEGDWGGDNGGRYHLDYFGCLSYGLPGQSL